MTGEFGSHLDQQIVLACWLTSERSNVVAAQCAAMEDGVGWQSCLFPPQHSLEVAEAICGTVFPIELKNVSSSVDEYQKKGYI